MCFTMCVELVGERCPSTWLWDRSHSHARLCPAPQVLDQHKFEDSGLFFRMTADDDAAGRNADPRLPVSELLTTREHILCGWFFKQGQVFLNRRFFLLDGDNRRLYVYTNDVAGAPRYFVPLNSACHLRSNVSLPQRSDWRAQARARARARRARARAQAHHRTPARSTGVGDADTPTTAGTAALLRGWGGGSPAVVSSPSTAPAAATPSVAAPAAAPKTTPPPTTTTTTTTTTTAALPSSPLENPRRTHSPALHRALSGSIVGAPVAPSAPSSPSPVPLDDGRAATSPPASLEAGGRGSVLSGEARVGSSDTSNSAHTGGVGSLGTFSPPSGVSLSPPSGSAVAAPATPLASRSLDRGRDTSTGGAADGHTSDFSDGCDDNVQRSVWGLDSDDDADVFEPPEVQGERQYLIHLTTPDIVIESCVLRHAWWWCVGGGPHGVVHNSFALEKGVEGVVCPLLVVTACSLLGCAPVRNRYAFSAKQQRKWLQALVDVVANVPLVRVPACAPFWASMPHLSRVCVGLCNAALFSMCGLRALRVVVFAVGTCGSGVPATLVPEAEWPTV